MPDRYADAVRARRAELRALRAQLAGGHRDELRSALALSRVTGTGGDHRRAGRAGRRSPPTSSRADRADRRRFPARLDRGRSTTPPAGLHGRWAAALRPALLRIAHRRGRCRWPPGWPGLPVAAGCPARSGPTRRGRPRRRLRAVLGGLAHGIAPLWRLLLVPLLVLPIWGLPAPGRSCRWSRWPPAAALAAVAARRPRPAAWPRSGPRLRRSRRRPCSPRPRVALEADLGRRLIELEARAAAALDAAVAPSAGRGRRPSWRGSPGPVLPTARTVPDG